MKITNDRQSRDFFFLSAILIWNLATQNKNIENNYDMNKKQIGKQNERAIKIK